MKHWLRINSRRLRHTSYLRRHLQALVAQARSAERIHEQFRSVIQREVVGLRLGCGESALLNLALFSAMTYPRTMPVSCETQRYEVGEMHYLAHLGGMLRQVIR